MNFLKKLECWRQTLVYNVLSFAEIKASDLNRLQKVSPRLACFFRRVVPVSWIIQDFEDGK
jgi:hypothetical protein